MGLFTWIASYITGVVGIIEVLFAILLSGLLFAYSHLPMVYAAGAKKSPMLIFATLSLNGWASLVFGFLFWSYGLTSAIVAHIFLHCMWFFLEKKIKPVT